MVLYCVETSAPCFTQAPATNATLRCESTWSPASCASSSITKISVSPEYLLFAIF